MTAQTVLSEKQSTYSGPYGFYTVTLTPTDRTLDSVAVKCDVTAHLQYSDSYTAFGVTCALYIGGAWHEFTLVKYGTEWRGTTPITASATFTVSGLSAAQSSIDDIKFKALAGDGETAGPSLSATDCAALIIDIYGGVTRFNIDNVWKYVLMWLNIDGVWRRVIIPWVRVVGAWRSSAGEIAVPSDLVSIVDDGNGNVEIVFADTATVEYDSDGNVNIVANCVWNDARGNVTISEEE